MDNHVPIIPINESRLFHFFVIDPSDLISYLEIHPYLELSLHQDDDIIANCKLSIKDFKNSSVLSKNYFEIHPTRQMKSYVWVSLVKFSVP